MKYGIFILLFIFTFFTSKKVYSHGLDEKINFIENKGQWSNGIEFMAKIGGGNVWIQKNSFTFDFYNQEDYEKIINNHNKNHLENLSIKHHSYKLSFMNANTDSKITGNFPSTIYHNYFIGNDQSKWASNVKLFSEINYLNLYNGINVKIGTSDFGNFKYNLIVMAGADATKIRWSYEGIAPFLKNNTIFLNSNAGEIIESIPEVYQIINGKKINVACQLDLKDGIISLIFPNEYNHLFELIIDPTVVFSTYSGSLSDNWGFTATYDSQENAYSSGPVIGGGFPVSIGAYDEVYSSSTNNHKCDIGIIKYSPDGVNRLYATYLGGIESEIPHSIIVDSEDNLILFGTTSSNNFPITAGAYDNSFNGGNLTNASNWFEYSLGSDIFVSKLNANGNQLLGSTYIGGNSTDGFNSAWQIHHNYSDQVRGEVVVDKNDNIIVASSTYSTDFPTTAASYSPNFIGGQDGVVFKFNSNLTTLVWSTFIGGTLDDCASGVNVNLLDENIYICGGTKSINFPVSVGSIHPTYQGGTVDAYVASLNPLDGSFIKGTYLGTNNYDKAYHIQSDENGIARKK